MLKFDAYFSVVICSRDGSTERWVELFAREFGNFTRADQVGGWVGAERVETEPNVKVTTWLAGDDWEAVCRFLDLAERYQVGAEQEAVFLEVGHSGKVQALVVFAGDWAECRAHLREVFDLGGALCDWFDARAAVETTPDGVPVVDDIASRFW